MKTMKCMPRDFCPRRGRHSFQALGKSFSTRRNGLWILTFLETDKAEEPSRGRLSNWEIERTYMQVFLLAPV